MSSDNTADILSRAPTIETYDELDQYVKEWAYWTRRGKFDRPRRLLVVFGRPGILKSSILEPLTTEAGGKYIEGFVAAKTLVETLCDFQDQILCFDDILPDSRYVPNMLQQLTDGYESTTVQWHGQVVKRPCGYDDKGRIIWEYLPRIVETTSRVCWAGNDLKVLGKNGALENRAFVVHFRPEAATVLKQVEKLGLISQYVAQWVWQRIDDLPHLEVRPLIQADIERLGGRDWQGFLERQFFNSRFGVMLALRKKYPDDGEARCTEWCRIFNLGRSAYFEAQAEFRTHFPERNLPRGQSKRAAS